MKLVKLLILTLILSSTLVAQSTERFIRIVGNAKKEVLASNAEVYFTLSEVKENTINKTAGKSYEEVYDDVVGRLAAIGVDKNSIEPVFQAGRSYRQGISKNFFLKTDLSKGEEIQGLSIQGFLILKLEYSYEQENEALETELSFKAIKDARRKAQAICDNIDMKLGKILNVEVKESSRNQNGTKQKTKLSTYKVTITFKLVE